MPFVPVMPTTVKDREGSPKKAEATWAKASRARGTTTWVAPIPSAASSTKSERAPRDKASGMNCFPSACSPRMAANR